MINFEVMGEPVGKGRPRFSMVNGHAMAFTPAKTASFENLVKLSYSQKYSGLSFSKGEQISAVITAYFSVPKSASKKARANMLSGAVRPVKKPDADNIIKSILDALNGIAYYDDSQVVNVICQKYYAENPRTSVILVPAEKFSEILTIH